MIDPKKLDELAKKLVNAVPGGVKAFGEDMQKTFHSILQGTFSKLDLVTREEFDAQVGVLQRTRKKVDALEKTVKAMEAVKPKKAPAKKK